MHALPSFVGPAVRPARPRAGPAAPARRRGMKALRQLTVVLLLVYGFGRMPLAVAADAFPSKPIRIVVPFGPGSGSDTATRILGQHLGTALRRFHFFGWVGLFAPAGTPAATVTQLSRQLQTTLALPEVVQRCQQLGAEAKWMGPAEFRQFVQTELTRQTKILKDIGVQPQ